MKSDALSLLVSIVCFCSVATHAQKHKETLTNAADVLALPAERALQAIPVSVTGVVTAAEDYWDGRFFVHDASGGVFVDNVNNLQPEPGDIVEVRGISHPGAFAPVISEPSWRRIGTGPLPRARPVTIEQLMSGIEDGQRVEITGIVRSVRIEHGLLSADLSCGGYRVQVFAKLPAEAELPGLIAARVRVRGTAAASFNAQLRQLITMKMFAPLAEDFVVEKPEATNPFSEPILPLNRVAQYRRTNIPGQRVHVKGVVTHQRLGEDLFIQDDTAGLHVRGQELTKFEVGDVVEAVGFPDFQSFLPVLDDAVFRKAGDVDQPVIAKKVSLEELQAGFHHAALVSVQGRLLDRTIRRLVDRANRDMRIKTLLTLYSDNFVFSAEAETSEDPAGLASIPIGSTIELSGVALAESNQEGKLKSLQILLPDSNAFRIRQRPGWLTTKRLSVGLAILSIVLIVATSWTVTLSRKNAALNRVVREKEATQIELQRAHDHLEEKVRERTAQLKLQITARKEFELQSRAVLAERTRLAQELHDTLEQTLTGIRLQLDITAKMFERNPETAQHHLELARDLVGQSQAEVRRSVWDLRSRAEEQFDLADSLKTGIRRIIEGTSMRVDVEVKGRVRPLPEVVEENLLRIAHEALNNVIKHAGATLAKIELNYGAADVVLEIRDNGVGFEVENCAGPRDGHFGLLGISERARRVRGEVHLSSTGKGTTLRVRIPLDS